MPFIKLNKWSLNQIAENEASHIWEKFKGRFRIRKAVPPTLHTLLYNKIETVVKDQTVDILVRRYRNSGIMSTDVPDVDTGIDWLSCFPQNSRQCQAQSRFAVHSRLDFVANSETMGASNQTFYSST